MKGGINTLSFHPGKSNTSLLQEGVVGIKCHHWHQAPDLVQIIEPCPFSEWSKGGGIKMPGNMVGPGPAMPEVHNCTPFQVRGPTTSLLCLSRLFVIFKPKIADIVSSLRKEAPLDVGCPSLM